MSTLTTAYQDDIRSSSIASRSNIHSPTAFVENKIVQHPFACDWSESLRARFQELVNLSFNWDGHGGQPVSFDIAMFAATVLNRLFLEKVPLPSLVPGTDGTLQIEWHYNGYDIELDILAPNDVVAYFYDHHRKEDTEMEIKANFGDVWKWLETMGEVEEPINADCSF